MTEQRKVKVMTTVPNGVELALREVGRDARYPGLRVHVPGSRTVKVGGDFALVDEGFMKAWLEQNENSQLVKSGALVVIAEDAPAPVDNVDQPEPETETRELTSGLEGDDVHQGASGDGPDGGGADEGSDPVHEGSESDKPTEHPADEEGEAS